MRTGVKKQMFLGAECNNTANFPCDLNIIKRSAAFRGLLRGCFKMSAATRGDEDSAARTARSRNEAAVILKRPLNN